MGDSRRAFAESAALWTSRPMEEYLKASKPDDFKFRSSWTTLREQINEAQNKADEYQQKKLMEGDAEAGDIGFGR